MFEGFFFVCGKHSLLEDLVPEVEYFFINPEKYSRDDFSLLRENAFTNKLFGASKCLERMLHRWVAKFCCLFERRQKLGGDLQVCQWRTEAGEGAGNMMRKARWVLHIVLFLCSIWVCRMGYQQVLAARSDYIPDTTTWLPKQEIVRLMRYHGADGMMVTHDAAYIMRDSAWISVMKREKV